MSKTLDDIKDDRIERSIGDAWNRVPHFTVERGETIGVLYFPTPNGMWGAKAFRNINKAAEFLAKKFPVDALEHEFGGAEHLATLSTDPSAQHYDPSVIGKKDKP